jgi:hypothetical protein
MQTFLDKKAETLWRGIVDHLRWDLNNVFKTALADGLVDSNPAAALFTPELLPLTADFPIFERRAPQPARTTGSRPVADLRHLFRRIRFEILHDADVIVELANGAAAYGCAVNRQAERIFQTFLGAQYACQKGVGKYFHGLNTDTALYSMGHRYFLEAQIHGVGSVKRHQDRIPLVVSLQHSDVRVRIVVASESEEAALSGFLGGLKGFNNAPGCEDLVYVGLILNAVHLPQVQIIRFHTLQRNMQLVLICLSSALVAFGSHENLLANIGENVAVYLLRVPIPIAMRTVEVVQAEVVCMPT